MDALQISQDLAPTGTTSPSEEEIEASKAQPWFLQTHEVIGRMGLMGEPIPTGCTFIDDHLRHKGIPPGKLVLIGGPPSSGKSLLLSMFMDRMSLKAP